MKHLPTEAEGFYKGRIVDHSISTNAETGSVTMSVKVEVDQQYDDDTKKWEAIDTHFVYGGFNMLGKGGTLGKTQKRTVQTIQELFDWYDGQISTLQEQDISGVTVMVDCQTSQNEEGEDRIRAEWLHVPVDEPKRGGGSMERLSPDKLEQLSNQFAGAFRAIAKPKASNGPGSTPAPAPVADPGPGF